MKPGFYTDIYLDHELARRLEIAEMESALAYAVACTAVFPDSGATAEAIGGGIAVYTGAGSPINRVHGLGMRSRVYKAEITACEDFFTLQREPTRIDLCPLADPSLLTELRRRRYGVAQFKHVWVRGIDTPSKELPAPPIVRVTPVDTAERALWAQVVASSFQGEPIEQANVDLALPTSQKLDTTCFLAWIGGNPAGGGALALHDGVGILYSTSVRPEFRRLGVHSALLEARVRYAYGQGCDILMVQTVPGSASQRNVERAGFRIAYTKPTMILDTPTQR
jgi:GNAT superfamily N-acetyltransferase